MLKLASALIAGFVAMGGWAVVTVKDLPEYFVAGQQYTIEFQVRQHGRTLLSGLRPQLVIESALSGMVIVTVHGMVVVGAPAAVKQVPPSVPVTPVFGRNSSVVTVAFTLSM